jgi:ubiquitin C-terminal hydrolase
MYGLAMAQIAGSEKADDLVDFPLESLDMREHCKTLKDEPEPVLYDLYAISNHFGSLNGGHYTAYCKNSLDQEWYNFDDSSVSKVIDEQRVITPAAYLLFYRRREQNKT